MKYGFHGNVIFNSQTQTQNMTDSTAPPSHKPLIQPGLQDTF